MLEVYIDESGSIKKNKNFFILSFLMIQASKRKNLKKNHNLLLTKLKKSIKKLKKINEIKINDILKNNKNKYPISLINYFKKLEKDKDIFVFYVVLPKNCKWYKKNKNKLKDWEIYSEIVFIGLQWLVNNKKLKENFNLFLDNSPYKKITKKIFIPFIKEKIIKNKLKLQLKDFDFLDSKKNNLIRTIDYLSNIFYSSLTKTDKLNFLFYNNFVTVYNFKNNITNTLSFNSLKEINF